MEDRTLGLHLRVIVPVLGFHRDFQPLKTATMVSGRIADPCSF